MREGGGERDLVETRHLTPEAKFPSQYLPQSPDAQSPFVLLFQPEKPTIGPSIHRLESPLAPYQSVPRIASQRIRVGTWHDTLSLVVGKKVSRNRVLNRCRRRQLFWQVERGHSRMLGPVGK